MKVLVDGTIKTLRIMDRRNTEIEWTEDFIENSDFDHDEDGNPIMTEDEYQYWLGEIELQESTDEICNELESLDVDWPDALDIEDMNDRNATHAKLRNLLDEIKPRRQIAANLVEARENAGITQAVLAGRVGTDRRMIGRYEDGSTDMSVMRLIEIAKDLGVTPESLFEGVE